MPTFRSLKFIATGSALAMVLQTISLLPLETRFVVEPLGVLELTPTALAKDSKRITYRPPVKLKRAIRTGGTGARGCNQLGRVEVMPLVPNNHVGQTLSKRPTFLAYVSGAKAVEFTLVEPNVEKPLVVKTVEPDAQGLVRIELPETAPDLAVGKDYRWSVSVVCNPNRRSNDVFAQSWIQRVESSAELQQKLSTASSEQERARIYAEVGVWYDAIAALTKANQSNPHNLDIRNDLTALLNQENLNQIGFNLPQSPQTVTSQPMPKR
ncbi:MAG: DUF928 domain-containing protein [Leptolyngbyaceae cyanobacterium bins.302]|nr:DUF928 domain-containing protein [Leptolyngbyaceae cyanobacterium bins.302]